MGRCVARLTATSVLSKGVLMSEVVKSADWDVRMATGEVDRLLRQVRDPRHRAILANYRRHVLLELAGSWPEILQPEMTVPQPVYRMSNAGQTVVRDGADEVAEFYRGLAEAGMTVSLPIEEKIVVADWGLAFESRFEQVLPGRVLVVQGFLVDDPAAVYRFSMVIAGIRSYDQEVRLIGEHVYADTGSVRLDQADPADIVTPERAAELVTPLLEEST
jgi:hypothetical protein